MDVPGHFRIHPIWYIVALAFILRLGWTLIIPFNAGHDEYIHYQQVRFIYDAHRLPVFGPGQDLFICIRGIHYASLPGINYVLSALLMHLIPAKPEFQYIVARLVSVFCGTGVVFLGYLVTRRLFPGRSLLIYGVPFFLAFLPGFIFIGSYVTNDSYAAFVSSLALYALIVTAQNGWRAKDVFLLGGTLGLVFLGKYTGYLIIPVVVLFLCGRFYTKPVKLGGILFRLFLAAFAVSGWWFVRSYCLYDGDLLGFKLVGEAGQVLGWFNPSLRAQGESVFEVLFQSGWLFMVMISFWGMFGPLGYEQIFLHMYYYLFIIIISLLFCYALFRKFLRTMIKQKLERLKEERFQFLLAMLFMIILSLGQIVYFCWNSDFQPMGRYLYTCAVPAGVFYLLGLESIVNLMNGRARRFFLIALSLFIVFLSQVSYFYYLVPAHYLWNI
ncbi:MAG TPA: hypothetical protein DCM26_01310 [Desulfotomaculum sp.]|jgi:4-amino-4-deoxy-L-arabinose transferase-like glycosyltransferase|nr:hypothetical protein [Desulfotomaculum sp.]